MNERRKDYKNMDSKLEKLEDMFYSFIREFDQKITYHETKIRERDMRHESFLKDFSDLAKDMKEDMKVLDKNMESLNGKVENIKSERKVAVALLAFLVSLITSAITVFASIRGAFNS